MTIKKKTYTTSSDYPNYACDFFSTAAELLGNEWEYKASTPGLSSYEGPSIQKKTSDGYYGWVAPTQTPDSPLKVSMAGTLYDTWSSQIYSIPSGSGNHTCVVWVGDKGSIGIGEEKNGRLCITLLMAKFDGKHDGSDVYALGCGFNPISNNHANLFGYRGANIGLGVNTSTINVGVGVYLHPLLEPTTGLTCSDVFGVQCYDNDSYKICGSVVKQGGNSYTSVLGANDQSMHNIIFIKT